MADSIAGRHGTFLVEAFSPATRDDVSSRAAARVRDTCADLRATGIEITYLGVLVVPDDELAFHVFAAADAGTALDASRRAGLRVERVVRSIVVCAGGDQPSGRHPLRMAVEPEGPVAYQPRELGPGADPEL